MSRSFTFVLLLVVCFALLVGPLAAQDAPEMPLAEHGPYAAGIRTLEFMDDARDERPVIVSLWYPGILPPDRVGDLDKLQSANRAVDDIPFDVSGAPYPIVLYSHGYGGDRDQLRFVVELLVSHGFVVATVAHEDDTIARTLIDRPLDIRFVIDQLEALNTGGDLGGLMDLDRAGLFGLSDGGYTALTMTGARIDEAFMTQWGTGERDTSDPTDPRNWYPDWEWNALKAYYDQFMPPAEDGFLQPLTDQRLDAIVSYLPCYAYIFGEEGLAAATVPTLFIGATNDTECPYEMDAVPAYAGLGSSDRFMLSLVGGNHGLPIGIHEEAVVHFITAFFAYYLQGDEEAGQYLNEEYVNQFDRLAWGTWRPDS